MTQINVKNSSTCHSGEGAYVIKYTETRMEVTATQLWIEVACGERRTGDGQGLTCVSPAQSPRALHLGVNVLLLLS